MRMSDRSNECLIELIGLASALGSSQAPNPAIWGRLPSEHERVFSQCLSVLNAEPELEHLTPEDAQESLWKLYQEAALNPHLFRDDQSIMERVETFWTNDVRSPVEYEVVFPIENLRMPDNSNFAVNDVSFRVLREEDLMPENVVLELAREQFIGAPTASMRVMARTSEQAAEIARFRCDETLNILRVCLLWPYNTQGQMTWDFQLQQHRSEDYLLREVRGASLWLSGWKLERSPVNMELDQDRRESLLGAAQQLDPVLSRDLPPRLRESLLRAIEWTGTSPIQRSYDDKVLSLCTALECFLATKDIRNKGAAIALHTMLLGMATRGFYDNPLRIYGLYELRSDIVHGSKHRVATVNDYQQLQLMTLDALERTLVFLAHNKNLGRKPIDRVSRFLVALRSRERLELAISQLSSKDHDFAKEITLFAEEQLGEQSETNEVGRY